MAMFTKVGVVGATGAVGSRMLSILEQRNFQVSELRPFASALTRGKEISFQGTQWPCRILEKGCFEGLDLVFFDVSDEISKEWVPEALAAKACVIDNSAVFRLDSGVSLGVPEVNRDAIVSAWSSGGRLFAGPNCSTVQLVVALSPLMKAVGLKRVVVSTYQSVSGAGAAAMDELKSQMEGPADPQIFPHPIASNLIPRIGKALDDGFTSEEMKLMLESRKILGLPELPIVATAVRVPTLVSHAEAVFVETERECSLEKAREIWSQSEGVELLDELNRDVYPMNINTANRDSVAVGRIRRDPSVTHGLCFWVVSDNLRKGAALNAVQIAETIRTSVQKG